MCKSFILEVHTQIPPARQDDILNNIREFQKFYGYVVRRNTPRVKLCFKFTLTGDYDTQQESETLNNSVKRLENWLESKYRIDVMRTTVDKI